ncbi:MAG: hypothetical protein KAY02_03825 [Acidovorax sp.]|jgi:hypothetical protein|nr:hypothetical protein [Acidovorax sp.]
MDPDKTKWRAGDWQAYALALEKAHQSALDGWGITVAELEKHAKIIADLRDNNERLHKHIDLLDTVVALVPAQTTVKRTRGRPKKHGDFNLAEWYESECLPRFKEHNYGATSGMQKVLTWHFQQVFRELGLNPQKVTHKDYQKKLKTMINLISDQRHPRWSGATS